MKKYLMSALALAFGIGVAHAGPVSESQAKYVGQQFVQGNFDATRQNSELTLVYTGVSDRSETCYYVFNVGNDGYVMVSADDFYRPIVGYSTQRAFPVENMPDGLRFFLNRIIENRAGRTGVATPKVAAEWELVANGGRLLPANDSRGVDVLLQTEWDQNAPYNMLCPEYAGGPGGRCYAGCVATAVSQIMKYWNHPAQGTGSVTYDSGGGNSGYPYIAGISANFGATTYDWDNMPNSISNSSSQAEKLAVATLMYHCGVAVHMSYSPNGSGAHSATVPGAINAYFGYTNQAVQRIRNNYTYANWYNLLKEQLDMGWPLYYSGCDATPYPDGPGCHAFVCDGYNDAGYFHWNFGWSGSGNDWIDFDAIEYSASSDAVILNFVPAEVYNSTAQAPTGLNVTPAANYELAATVTWTNPSKTLNNSNLTSIDQIVVTRNGQIIHTEDNVTPGAQMSFVDNTVPRFDAFTYTVYAISNGAHGKVAIRTGVSFGPTCNWSVIITKSSVNGFRGAAIHAYNPAGTEFQQVTSNNSSVQTFPIDVPVGPVSFGWTGPIQGDPFEVGFVIKNSENTTVYTFNGLTSDLEEGIFFTSNNTCGNPVGTEVPTNMVAMVDSENPNNIHVSWDGVSNVGYGYVVYRDNQMYRLIPEATSFIDEDAPNGGHCYYVGVLSEGGENGLYSNESCATAGACYPPTNLDYETTGANFKIKLKWERPEISDNLTGYYLYRKSGEDGTYERIKLISASSTSHTDNPGVEGDYYYKLYAYYRNLGECTSSPAAWKYDDNQFYLHVYYSPTGMEESASDAVKVYPNPAKDNFTVVGEGLTHVSVFNAIGQMVYDASCEGKMAQVSMSNVEPGIYMVRIATANGISTKRITVVR